jgi:hypothetical protein
MRALVLLPLACLAAASAALAQGSQAPVYKVYQFADDRIPAMDGDLSDWAVLPPDYFVGDSLHQELHRGLGTNRNPADLEVKRVAVGWSDSHNRLYFMAEVYDDVHRFGKENTDSLDTFNSRLTGAFVHGADIWEIVLDADHADDPVIGFADENPEVEMRYRSAFTQNYHLYIPPLNGTYWHWLWGKATWTAAPAYSGVGWKYPGPHLSAGTVTYECYLTPFDYLHPDGPDSSVVHDLRENEAIGLSWAFLDADSSATDYDAFWSLSKDGRMYNGGPYLMDFRLMPLENHPDAAPARP